MTREDPLAGEPFSYRQTRDGLVMISHSGRLVKTLRGAEAARFLTKAEAAGAAEAQQLMARATGQFKFGNERAAKKHPRHRRG